MENQEIIQSEITTLEQYDNELVVCNQLTYELAGKLSLELNDLAKRIKDYWEEPIRSAHEAHKALTGKRAEMLKPVENRLKSVKQKMSDYATIQDRIRREEQRKAEEARLQLEAEERARLQTEAHKAASEGDMNKAIEIQKAADNFHIQPEIISPTVEKTTRTDAGTISTKTDVEVNITDMQALIKEIAEGRAPMILIKIDESKLKSFVKLQQLKSFPGLAIREVVNTVLRTKTI